jgi:transcriptional regulator GlxA family with amidase domain
MKKVAVIVSEDSVFLNVSGVLEVLNKTNEHVKRHTGKTAYQIATVGQRKTLNFERMKFTCDCTVGSSYVPDIVLIPAVLGEDMKAVLERNKLLVQWIKKMAMKRKQVGSMCVGSFLLAATGLLDGKRATTHWRLEKTFSEMFPKVNLQIEKIIVDNGFLFSGGGATSFFNLLLYFIDKTVGRETMLDIAKSFLIDPDKLSQSHFSLFATQRSHHDKMVLQIQEQIEKNYATLGGVESLATKAEISTRHFIRRFKSATGITPLTYLQRVRIEAAREAFELTDKRVTEVLYDVGYSDEKSFRQLFKRYTGLAPMEYKRKFQFGHR